MNRYFSSDVRNNKNTLYCGNGDAFTSNSINITEVDLLRDIKLGALCYDHLIFSAAFFWQNRILTTLSYKLEGFILHGFVLPSVRDPDQTNDIYDYMLVRQEETNRVSKDTGILENIGIIDEVVTSKDVVIAKRINSFKSIIHQESISVRDHYRILYKQDLKDQIDPDSMYSIIQGSIFSNEYEELIGELIKVANRPDFSRSVAVSEFHKMRVNAFVLKKLTIRLSYLFLIANSKVYNSDLLISSSQKELYKPVANSVEKGNLFLLYSVLSSVGITFHDIDRLNVNEIVVIKSSDEFKRFYEKYSRIIKVINYYEEKSIDEVISYITREVRIRKGLRILRVPVVLFKNLSKEILTTLIYKETGIESTIITNSIISTGYDFIEKIFPKLEIFNASGIEDFANYIISKKYAEGVQILIEQIEKGRLI